MKLMALIRIATQVAREAKRRKAFALEDGLWGFIESLETAQAQKIERAAKAREVLRAKRLAKAAADAKRRAEARHAKVVYEPTRQEVVDPGYVVVQGRVFSSYAEAFKVLAQERER